jgi:hypothetical protein
MSATSWHPAWAAFSGQIERLSAGTAVIGGDGRSRHGGVTVPQAFIFGRRGRAAMKRKAGAIRSLLYSAGAEHLC